MVGRINLTLRSSELVKPPINLWFHASEMVKPSIEYKSGLSHEMVICRSVAPPLGRNGKCRNSSATASTHDVIGWQSPGTSWQHVKNFDNVTPPLVPNFLTSFFLPFRHLPFRPRGGWDRTAYICRCGICRSGQLRAGQNGSYAVLSHPHMP